MTAIGKLSLFALDCPDALALARFYSAITGWPVASEDTAADDHWVELDPGTGSVTIAFQQVASYRPPVWPGSDHPQQAHLDFDVPDLDKAEKQVLTIGARKGEVQPGETFRVFLDPVGHPFCLVLIR
ncbi:MAG: glyoxalase [Pseudonocardia sp.]|jgi:catechol 2,3-dioxygenase-like lactoylglutathione lyase family enzyme|uniref:VOC family protein n=1 Tax=Pseudonocardia sp. TaxID=60912 RepID=UPI0026029ACF|nr:VOC family protein [Pseudonocardia sp.]MCU1630023.1 glyoxalase [Pseudonocardia sp.]